MVSAFAGCWASWAVGVVGVVAVQALGAESVPKIALVGEEGLVGLPELLPLAVLDDVLEGGGVAVGALEALELVADCGLEWFLEGVLEGVLGQLSACGVVGPSEEAFCRGVFEEWSCHAGVGFEEGRSSSLLEEACNALCVRMRAVVVELGRLEGVGLLEEDVVVGVGVVWGFGGSEDPGRVLEGPVVGEWQPCEW